MRDVFAAQQGSLRLGWSAEPPEWMRQTRPNAPSPRRLHPQRIARFDRAHGTPERDRGPVQLGSVDTVRTVTAPNLTVMAVICVQGPGGLGPCEEVVPADDGRVFSGRRSTRVQGGRTLGAGDLNDRVATVVEFGS